MAQLEDILSALGGLNTDDSLISPPTGQSPFQEGDYRYARNVRIGSSYEDNTGAVENLPSTLLIDNYYTWNDTDGFVLTTAPTGTFTCLNKLEDPKNWCFYYFVKTSVVGEGYILKFEKSERKIYELLYWTGLNFQSDNPIQSCLIGNYLIFCDGNFPNRIVDVTDIYRLKFTLGSNFSEYHISFHKWSPLVPAYLSRASASTANEYTIKGIFQFSYRYIYKGGLRSTFAPPSFFCTNEITGVGYDINLNVPGFLYDYETPFDGAFGHSSIKFYEVVEFIEFSYRQSEKDGWKLWKRYTVDTGSNDSFTFTNSGPSASIPEVDSGQYFDSVPFSSGACEAMDNRPMFGNNLDDLDADDDFDVEDVEVYSESPGTWNGPSSAFSSITSPQRTALGLMQDVKQFTFKEKGIYKLGIIYQHFSGRTGLVKTLDKWTYTIPSKTGLLLTTSENIHALGFNIPASVYPPTWAVAYQIVRSNCLNIEMFIQGEVNDIKFLANDDNAETDWITTPDGVKSSLSDYYDNTSIGSTDLPLYSRVMGQTRKNKEVANVTLCSRIYFSIGNWFLTAKADAAATLDNPANNVFYNFLRGDRVRFMGGFGGISYVWYDEEIIDYTGKGIIISKPIISGGTVDIYDRTTALSSQPGLFQIEIYRPKKFDANEKVIFYEMGEWYPVLHPTTTGKDFSKRDFRWTNAASVTATTLNGHTYFNKMPITNGDAWIVNKNFYYDYFDATKFPGTSIVTKWVQMTQDKLNSAGYWEHNTGRPLLPYGYNPKQLQKEHQIRFGGKYLEDSIFIAINTFRDRNQFNYPQEYGKIRAMVNTSNAQVESVGNIMLVLGENEAWSVYVNRTTFEDLSGRQTVSLSDQVLGSYNTLLGSQGTLNPESVSRDRGRVLWWNTMEGAWVRYSRDGLTAVSEIGMKNWFKDIALLIINEYATTTKPKVISVFDGYHDEWITRIDHSSLPSTFREYASYKCLSFAERNNDKRWKSVYDYAPDRFAKLDNEVYSIVGIKVHIHEAGVDFGKIYGSAVPSQLELVANGNSRQVKDWRGFTVDATDKWSFERIRGDWRSNSVTIQESRIPITSLEKIEDTYWAPIKRDINSPNGANPVITGNYMKSKSLRLLLQLDPTVDYLTALNWVIASYDLSAKNPKN